MCRLKATRCFFRVAVLPGYKGGRRRGRLWLFGLGLFWISRGFNRLSFWRAALFTVQGSRAESFPHCGCRALFADELEDASVNESVVSLYSVLSNKNVLASHCMNTQFDDVKAASHYE